MHSRPTCGRQRVTTAKALLSGQGEGGGRRGLGLQDLEARAQGSELGRTLQVFRGSSLRLGLQAQLVNWRELRQPAYDAIRASGLQGLKS